VVIIAAAVVASIWELRGTLAQARNIQISWIPIVVGSVAIIALAWPYGQSAQGIGLALTALACMVWRFPRGASGYLADVICVEGDPSKDVTLLGEPDCIKHVMIGGKVMDISPPAPRKPISGWRHATMGDRLTRELVASRPGSRPSPAKS